MKLSENPVLHERLKHIEIKYYYIRDMSAHDQVLMHRREWMSWGHVVDIESYP
jgi:hypothetical protein